MFGKKKAKDPVCGMDVDVKTAQYKSEYGGKTYYFCAASCKSTFDKEQLGSTPTAAKSDGTCGCCR
jgi:YHS domain-containing protein